MKFWIWLLFGISLLMGEELELSLGRYSANSSYRVEDPQAGLVSRLLFPAKADILAITLSGPIAEGWEFSLSGRRKSRAFDRSGEDFDFMHRMLTVYSRSRSRLQKFEQLSLTVTKRYDAVFWQASLEKMRSKIGWYDTQQRNLLRETYTQTEGETLRYEQRAWRLIFSPGWRYRTTELLFTISGSLFYHNGKTIDRHLLRHFFTVQKPRGIGYGYRLKLCKALGEACRLCAHYHFTRFSDHKTEMEYYTSEGFGYLALPSAFTTRRSFSLISVDYRF